MTTTERLPVVFVACQVLQDILQRLLPADLAQDVTFMDYGLHRYPAKMTVRLQEVLDELPEPSLVVLGYGLCGNGLDGVKAGRHTLLMPRADDCISILLGSRQAYMREFEAEPGTYYLSKGWLESGSNPLSEYREYVEKYGAKDAEWVMDMQYQHYTRLVFVAHKQADLDQYRPQAQEVADYCRRWDMRYEEILGSDRYVRRLIEVAAALDKADGEFLVVPPGGEIRQEQFI